MWFSTDLRGIKEDTCDEGCRVGPVQWTSPSKKGWEIFVRRFNFGQKGRPVSKGKSLNVLGHLDYELNLVKWQD